MPKAPTTQMSEVDLKNQAIHVRRLVCYDVVANNKKWWTGWC